MNDVLNAVEAFAGIGGFGIALERAGVRIDVQIEKDEACLLVLENHFPDVKRIRDVKEANAANCPDEPFLLVGGSPCTNLSLAGNRKGLAGVESGLWFEFHRLIRETKPRFVIFENVPGLLSANFGFDMAIILAGFTGIVPAVPDGGWRNAGIARRRGDDYYDVAYRVLDSQYWRVAQRRRRVFLVAGLGSYGSCAPQVLFERARLSRSSPARRPSRSYPAAEIESGAGSSDCAGLEAQDGLQGAPSSSYTDLPDGRDGAQSRGGSRELLDTENMPQIPYNIIGVNGNAKERHAYPTETANTLDTWTGVEDKNAGSTVILETGETTAFRMRAFGDFEEDQIASALKSRDYKDATDLITTRQARSSIRRLTPVETERLQAFPDGWSLVKSKRTQKLDAETTAYLKAQYQRANGVVLTDDEVKMLVADNTRYRQTGNAVTVNVVEWIIKRLVALHRGEEVT